MRIAIDGRAIQDHFPGIGRYTYNLAQALVALAPEEEWLLLFDPGAAAARLSPAALRGPASLQLVPVRAGIFALHAQWQIPALLRRLRAEVYHAPYYIMPYLPGRPAVVTVYDLIPLRYAGYFTPVQRLLFGVTMRLALHAARRVITLSAITATDLRLRLGVPEDKLAIIPAAAGPSFEPRPGAEIAELCARLRLPTAYVLYVASNKPHKNLSRLVQAWAQVKTDLPLVIAGHWDPRYPEAKRVAETLGLGARLRWLGPVAEADLGRLYSGATLFVFPSEYEGFGLPVLEAMACGAPVLCARTGSLAEVAGDAAVRFDPLDVAGMAAALQRLLDRPDLRLALRAQSLARAAQFTWEQAARETLAVYRSAA